MTQPVDPLQQVLARQQHLAQWQARLEQLVQQNRATYEELARQGFRFPFEQVVIAQIDCLIESVAEAMGPQGPEFALMARVRWEERTAQNLAAAKQQGVKAQLGQAASFSPGQIRDLARATGTHGA